MSKTKEGIEKAINQVGEVLNRTDLKAKGIKLQKSKEKYVILYTVNKVLEGVKVIKPDTNYLEIGEGGFVIDTSKYIYKDKFRTYFLLDATDGQQHIDLGDKFKFNPKFLKKIVREQIIAQSFTRFTGQQAKMSLYLAIFVGLFGGLIGYIIGLISAGVI